VLKNIKQGKKVKDTRKLIIKFKEDAKLKVIDKYKFKTSKALSFFQERNLEQAIEQIKE